MQVFDVAARLLCAYLVAGAILVLYVRRSNFDAHAHVPFSGFPEFLVWSPLAPAFIVSAFAEHRGDGVTCLLIFGAAFALVSWLLLRTRVSKPLRAAPRPPDPRDVGVESHLDRTD